MHAQRKEHIMRITEDTPNTTQDGTRWAQEAVRTLTRNDDLRAQVNADHGLAGIRDTIAGLADSARVSRAAARDMFTGNS